MDESGFEFILNDLIRLWSRKEEVKDGEDDF